MEHVEIANQLQKIDAYIFDLDGTVYLGESLLPGAKDAITELRSSGKRIIFLSNNPTQTRGHYATKLTRLGIDTPASDVVNSSYVMVQWLLHTAPNARLFVVGEPPLVHELERAGFEITEKKGDIEIVIASFDRTFVYHKLQVAFDAIRSGARLVATNGDKYCPVPDGGQPDAASIIAAIEACTGVRCDPIVGKPSPIMLTTVMDLIRLPPEKCILVGDRIETDIAMGFAAGMATCLVLTGDATRDKLASSSLVPTRVIETLETLL